ncbi:hypothetical protein BGZ73_002066 [Actinomortierella ambigua]|nr:hypothetical protein BGZ73_002066 [Actinomortierella ambigua]
MKPNSKKSIDILKHAPRAHRIFRPLGDARRRQGVPNEQLLAPAAGAHGLMARPQLARARTPQLLRRSTRQSFMELELPSIRALRSQPSMMELDPPETLFHPAPQSTQYTGPWAFFQAAEAQREQKQLQMEYLTRLQELRLRDETLFVKTMADFARDFPVQFAQLTKFMHELEAEKEAEKHKQQLQTELASRDSVLALAEYFGQGVQRDNKVGLMNEKLELQHQEIQQQQRQMHMQQLLHSLTGANTSQHIMQPTHSGISKGGRGRDRDRGGRGGRGGGVVPALRRGKTFQQQQQILQQITAQLQQQQQQQRIANPLQSAPQQGLSSHELMQYIAFAALTTDAAKGQMDPRAAQAAMYLQFPNAGIAPHPMPVTMPQHHSGVNGVATAMTPQRY